MPYLPSAITSLPCEPYPHRCQPFVSHCCERLSPRPRRSLALSPQAVFPRTSAASLASPPRERFARHLFSLLLITSIASDNWPSSSHPRHELSHAIGLCGCAPSIRSAMSFSLQSTIDSDGRKRYRPPLRANARLWP